MPLYEYRCEKCGKVFEVRQKFSDDPLKTHEECGGPVERLISAPALQFKGSGFYITDYARGGSSSSSSPAKSDGKASGESKSESKPAETKTSESKSDSKPSKD